MVNNPWIYKALFVGKDGVAGLPIWIVRTCSFDHLTPLSWADSTDDADSSACTEKKTSILQSLQNPSKSVGSVIKTTNNPPRFLHPVTFLPLTKNCFAVAAYILARFQARNHNKRGSQNGSTWQRHERPTDIWSTSTAYILSKWSPKTVAVGTAKTHRPRPQQYRKALLDSPWARRLHCQWKDKHGHQNGLMC